MKDKLRELEDERMKMEDVMEDKRVKFEEKLEAERAERQNQSPLRETIVLNNWTMLPSVQRILRGG